MVALVLVFLIFVVTPIVWLGSEIIKRMLKYALIPVVGFFLWAWIYDNTLSSGITLLFKIVLFAYLIFMVWDIKRKDADGNLESKKKGYDGMSFDQWVEHNKNK